MYRILSLCLVFVLTACVYRIDIQQGNILAQKDIDKLRPGLTKNQVLYVLGAPVADDAFADDNWHYLYLYKAGKDGVITRKELNLKFVDDKLVSAEGDYDIPESFRASTGASDSANN